MSFFLYFNYYKLGLILNGRSHGNKILKLRKYLASKSRAKLAWAMPNAARYSLSKNERPIIAHVISENWHETASKDATKKCRKTAWVDWMGYYLQEERSKWVSSLSGDFSSEFFL